MLLFPKEKRTVLAQCIFSCTTLLNLLTFRSSCPVQGLTLFLWLEWAFGLDTGHCNKILWLLYWAIITQTHLYLLFQVYVCTDWDMTTPLLDSCVTVYFSFSVRYCVSDYDFNNIVLMCTDVKAVFSSSQLLMCCDHVLPTSVHSGNRPTLTFICVFV